MMKLRIWMVAGLVWTGIMENAWSTELDSDRIMVYESAFDLQDYLFRYESVVQEEPGFKYIKDVGLRNYPNNAKQFVGGHRVEIFSGFGYALQKADADRVKSNASELYVFYQKAGEFKANAQAPDYMNALAGGYFNTGTIRVGVYLKSIMEPHLFVSAVLN